jgi:hypothetical protein
MRRCPRVESAMGCRAWPRQEWASWNVGVTSVRAPIDASDKKTTGDDAAEAFLMLERAAKCGK